MNVAMTFRYMHHIGTCKFASFFFFWGGGGFAGIRGGFLFFVCFSWGWFFFGFFFFFWGGGGLAAIQARSLFFWYMASVTG